MNPIAALVANIHNGEGNQLTNHASTVCAIPMLTSSHHPKKARILRCSSCLGVYGGADVLINPTPKLSLRLFRKFWYRSVLEKRFSKFSISFYCYRGFLNLIAFIKSAVYDFANLGMGMLVLRFAIVGLNNTSSWCQ